eukprot:TRINITY_DN8728_c0_g1_i1.p1 TRINITY_DN8728_c0_g1~~TRINITY_DN8728_c0_g1_i1.p1  ORF type:complete len:366 (-),score=131.99 TRINITY_DN8728_c0_g1_i1:1161-2219(-)
MTSTNKIKKTTIVLKKRTPVTVSSASSASSSSSASISSPLAVTVPQKRSRDQAPSSSTRPSKSESSSDVMDTDNIIRVIKAKIPAKTMLYYVVPASVSDSLTNMKEDEKEKQKKNNSVPAFAHQEWNRFYTSLTEANNAIKSLKKTASQQNASTKTCSSNKSAYPIVAALSASAISSSSLSSFSSFSSSACSTSSSTSMLSTSSTSCSSSSSHSASKSSSSPSVSIMEKETQAPAPSYRVMELQLKRAIYVLDLVALSGEYDAEYCRFLATQHDDFDGYFETDHCVWLMDVDTKARLVDDDKKSGYSQQFLTDMFSKMQITSAASSSSSSSCSTLSCSSLYSTSSSSKMVTS